MTTRRDFLATGAAVFVAGPAMAQDRPVIACDSYPIAYFAERLAGDLAEIRFPVPAGVDPSFWRPSIAEITAIQAADLIVLNGAGFAQWTTKTTLPRARTVDTSAGFADKFIATETVTHSHGADGEHSHTGTASYTWLDFALAAKQAEALSVALQRVLPSADDEITAKLADISNDLTSLDIASREVGAIAKDVSIIASHPRYQYFGRAYGLDLSYVEWDAHKPTTAEQWQALEQTIAANPARLFIWEAEPSPEAISRIDALGLVSAVVPPLANKPKAGDFSAVMEQSLRQLNKTLEELSAG